jgi:hypothetical protein
VLRGGCGGTDSCARRPFMHARMHARSLTRTPFVSGFSSSSPRDCLWKGFFCLRLNLGLSRSRSLSLGLALGLSPKTSPPMAWGRSGLRRRKSLPAAGWRRCPAAVCSFSCCCCCRCWLRRRWSWGARPRWWGMGANPPNWKLPKTDRPSSPTFSPRCPATWAQQAASNRLTRVPRTTRCRNPGRVRDGRGRARGRRPGFPATPAVLQALRRAGSPGRWIGIGGWRAPAPPAAPSRQLLALRRRSGPGTAPIM